MKNKLMRMTAGILFVCMLFGNIPTVYGAQAEQSEQSAILEQAGTGNTDSGENPAGTETEHMEDVSDGVAPGDASVQEQQPSDDQTEGMTVADNPSPEEEEESQPSYVQNRLPKDEINFIYIESPYLETPGTQRIVFSLEDGIAAENITITVARDSGSEEEWQLSRREENLYLFEKQYSGDAYSGVYQVTSVNLYGGQTDRQILLNSDSVTAKFGVNREYEGVEELQALDGESGDTSPLTEASVVTIEADGTTKEQRSIAEALNAVSADLDSSGVESYSLDSSASSAKTGNIIVALDPGHDSTHAGAHVNGLSEEELTLKIANYCKEELEQYAGVEVYMTRTGASCPHPGSSSSGDDIGRRVNAAADAGAQIYVSLHLNSSVSSSANGAEVIIPNKNWKPNVASKGEALAREIMDELVALGLGERSIYSKDTTVNEKYPDGSLSDYFAVQIYSKERGIPGIIIEHAFMSNSSDANNFLKTEAGLKKLGVADATGIAQYLGLSKTGQKVTVEEGTYTIESLLAPGMRLEIGGGTENGASVLLGNSNNNLSSQRFEIISCGDGYYNIVAEHSGKALEVKGGAGQKEVYVQQNKLNTSSNAQKWYFRNAGDGYYYLCSALETYMDIRYGSTADGTPIWMYDCNGSAAQKWKLVESSYRPLENGTYSIANRSNTNYVVDIASMGISDGSNVQLEKWADRASQRYEVSYVGGGYYRIVAEHSDKSLDIFGGSAAVGANVQQYSWNGSNAQLWKFVSAGNGYYYIRSKLGTVVGIATQSAQSSSNICMSEMSFGSAQAWKLQKTEYKPVQNGTYSISNITSEYKVLNVVGDNVELGSYSGLSSQLFDITYSGNGYYQILCKGNAKVFDVFGGSSQNEANIWTYENNGSEAQLWKFVDSGEGSYYIKSKLGTVVDLKWGSTSVGTNVQTYTLNGSSAQKWILSKPSVSTNERPIENGTYTIRNNVDSSKVLDVAGGYTTDGASVQIYTSNNTAAQRFEITYIADGYYRVTAEHSDKVLDIVYGSSLPGAKVQQYTWNNSSAQLWRIIETGEGTYYLQSKLGTVLGLTSDTASNGTSVQMEELNGIKSQKWSFEKTDYKPVKDGQYVLSSQVNGQFVFDVKYGSALTGAEIWLYSYSASDSQLFDVAHVDNGYYKITSKLSGLVVQSGSNTYQTGSGVTQEKWQNLDSQLWKFVSTGNGFMYVKSKTGTVVGIMSADAVDGAKLQMGDGIGTSAQGWKLVSASDMVIPPAGDTDDPSSNGTYVIRTALNTGKVLDVWGGSKENGANIQIYQQNDSQAQTFTLTKVTDEYYKISAGHSGKVLDVWGGSSASGANVQQYEWNGSDAQLWKLVDAGNGQYYIQSKLGTVLEVTYGSTANGANVQTYALNRSTAQKWILDDNSETLYRIMGESEVTLSQMVAFYNSRAKEPYPYADTDAPTIENFCRMYLEECAQEGVKAEVAFSQAMKETGFLKFGGDVDKNQYNFAGLGATGNGAKGESFPNVRTGIRAQVQHLKAYASTEPLNNPKVDTRFDYVKRGVAEYVQWLGVNENPNSTSDTKYGWATDPGYGYSIVESYIIPLKAL